MLSGQFIRELQKSSFFISDPENICDIRCEILVPAQLQT